MMLVRTIMVIAVLMLGFVPALAVNPDEVLKDPALEARARSLSTELRCLVCQNQSIDESDAPLARDLRVLLRERLVAGDSDDQVIAYLVGRYGEFVLLKPRFGVHTIALWVGPFALLALGGFLAWRNRWRFAQAEDKTAMALSPEEERRIEELLKSKD